MMGKPLQTIKDLWSAAAPNKPAEAIEAITQHFEQNLQDPATIEQLPLLNNLPYSEWPQHKHKLCRFRGMIQDTLGSEFYAASSSTSDGKSQICNLFQEATGEGEPDLETLTERSLFVAVNVPGQQDWVDGEKDAAVDLSALKLEDCQQPDWMEKKFLRKSTNNRGILIKVYTNDDGLQSTSIVDFFGVLDLAHFYPGDMEPSDTNEPTTYTLHAVHHKIMTITDLCILPTSQIDSDNRTSLIAYLAQGLGGDMLAAEFLLLAIIARVYARKGGLLLGSFSLNLSVGSITDIEYANLVRVLSSIVICLSELELSISALNSSPAYQPSSHADVLTAGQLQLPRGTILIANELGMGEGTLQDRGVKNVKALSRVVAEQKLGYVFPFSEFDFDTDFSTIVVSNGKSLLQTTCIVPVEKSSRESTGPSPDQLQQWRSLIATARYRDFTVGDAISTHIENDFVKIRQESAKGSGSITHEDLMLRMTIARLVGLSRGESKLSTQSYEDACRLDDARRKRLSRFAKH